MITWAVTQLRICHFPVLSVATGDALSDGNQLFSGSLKTDTCRNYETKCSGKTLVYVFVSFSS